MTTINAATIYAEVLAHRLALAQTIAELEPDYLPAYARLAGTKTELYLGDAVKRAVPSLVTIKTSARGSMRIANTLYRLDSFAAIVKSKAAIFGGGFAKAERKAKPLVTWSTAAIKVACEAMQDNDYAGAVQIAEEKLGGFFVAQSINAHNKNKPRAVLCIAPMPVKGMPDNFVSARVVNGGYQVFDLSSGFTVSFSEKLRSKAESAAIEKWASVTPEKQNDILANAKKRDPIAARAQWFAEYELSEKSEIEHFAALAKIQLEEFEVAESARIEREKLEKVAQIAETMRVHHGRIAEIAAMADRAKRLISAKARRAERQKAAAQSRAYDVAAQAKKDHAQLQTEGNRIRKAAQAMQAKGLPEIAAKYEALALSHDLKDERGACMAAADVTQVAAMAQAVAVIESAQTAPLSKVDAFLQSSGFTPMRQGQAKKTLQGLVRFENSFMAVHEWVSVLMSCSPKLHEWQEDKIKAFSKKQELKATIYEYLQHEEKREAAGTKTVYAIGDHFAGATEYAYAQYLQIQAIEPAIEAELAIVCEGEASEAQGISMGSTSGNNAPGAPDPINSHSGHDYHGGRVTVQYFDENEKEESKESHYAAIAASNTPVAHTPPAQAAIESVAEQVPNLPEALDAAYANRRITTYGRINKNDCFQFSKSGEVFVKCANGYRPGRGGELVACDKNAAVWFYDPARINAAAAPAAPAAPIFENPQAEPVQSAAPAELAKLADFIESVRNDGQPHRCPTGNKQKAAGKSGAWTAELYKNAAGTFVLQFMGLICGLSWTFYSTAGERIRALQVMARDADTPAPVAPAEALKAPAAPAEDSTSPAPVNPPADRGVGGVARSNLESSPAFARCKPFNFDPRELLTDGVTAAQLVGLGVNYTGNMANPSGEGAITSVTDSRGEKWGELRMVCTLEDGRIVNAEPHYFTASLRPILQFNSKHHGAVYLAELATAAMLKQSSESSAAELAKQAHAKALAALPLEFPHLKQGAAAAVNIRAALKKSFKGVKFSVTSRHSAIDVVWTDGPTGDQVDDVIGRFDIGQSDSQSDYFYTTATAFSELFGGVQYLFTRRELSDALIQAAIDKHYEGQDDKPSLADYRNHAGRLCWSSYHVDSDLHWFNETLKSMTL